MSRLTRSRRISLAGLYLAGIVYFFYIVFSGGHTADVIVGIPIMCALVYATLVGGEINKKELAFVMIAIIGYMTFSLILVGLTHVELIVVAGLAIWAASMSQPKFPLTPRAMVTGLLVGTIMTFLGIYLALKLGIVYFVGAEMLGALILTTHGKYTQEENTVVVAIANTSSMVALGALIAFPTIAIFRPEIASSVINYPFIVLVTGISGLCGILILAPMRERFKDEPWPQVRPQAECIVALAADESAKKDVLLGMTVAGAWVGASKIGEQVSGVPLSSVPNGLQGVIPVAANIPDWVGISNSPLIASIGYFIGWKRVLILICGSIISLIMWVILEAAQPLMFAEHLQRPEILYLALGIFASVIFRDVLGGLRKGISPEEFESATANHKNDDDNVIIIEHPHKASEIPRFIETREQFFDIDSFRQEIRAMIEDPREYLKSRRGQVPLSVSVVSLAIYMILGILVFSVIAPWGEEVRIHWALFVFGTPLVIVSAYFTARAISETGMLAGYISDMVAIPAILFFRVAFAAITTFMAMLGALQDSAIALLVHLKLGRLTGVRGRDILKSVLIGVLLGTFVGSLITLGLYNEYGFGGTDLPSPAAQLFGFLIERFLGTLSEFQLPGLEDLPGVHPALGFAYLMAFGLCGFLAGRELSKRGMSAISLVVGLLIPPATTLTMTLGGFIDYRLKRGFPDQPETVQQSFCDPLINRTSRILSGVIAGEAVVVFIWVGIMLFLAF